MALRCVGGVHPDRPHTDAVDAAAAAAVAAAAMLPGTKSRLTYVDTYH